MKKIALIPARYASTRFPAKLLQLIGDQTVIFHTWYNTLATGLFDEVIVVTDHDEIARIITNAGGIALKSSGNHESGTDRIAEAAAMLDAEIILNVQGDEPFIDKQSLAALLDIFSDPSVEVGSLYNPIKSIERVSDPNVVKVVLDMIANALYFSRSPIPYQRDQEPQALYHEHVGVYAFRKKTLLLFSQLSPTKAEMIEKIECLRFLENGIKIRMVETNKIPIKIDVPQDLEIAKAYYHQHKKTSD